MDILGRDFWVASNLFGALFLGLILSGGEGVKIRDMRVPGILRNGTEESAILDCDYTLDIPASKSGLVVKWFFNNHPAPVYQWIYNKKPQYLGVLKGKVNLNYRATNEESTMYRGFEITTPTVELSGEYKCLVSTFDKEDSRSQKMIIYVPEKSLEVIQDKPTDNSVQINCTAEGVFPRPNITILAEGKEKGNIKTTTISPGKNNSLYEISGSLSLNDLELDGPTTFECLLRIPEADYISRKNLVYFPASATSISPSILSMVFLSLIAAFTSTGL